MDVCKVKTVQKPQLIDLVDAIVCPINGFRWFAEWLASGDYDGDKGLVLYDPDIVKYFPKRGREVFLRTCRASW